MSGSRLAHSMQRPQQQRQVARGTLKQRFLVHILDSTDIQSVHTSGVELMREIPLDPFSALPLQPSAPLAPNAPPVK